MRGSRGTPLAFLWGIKRGYSLRKENTPFYSRPCTVQGFTTLHGAGETLFLFLSLQLRKLFFLELAIRHLTD